MGLIKAALGAAGGPPGGCPEQLEVRLGAGEPHQAPQKVCPECGDPFDDGDIR